MHKNQFEGRINSDHWLQQENSGHRTYKYKVSSSNLLVQIIPPHIKFGQERKLLLFFWGKCVFIIFKEKHSTNRWRCMTESDLFVLIYCFVASLFWNVRKIMSPVKRTRSFIMEHNKLSYHFQTKAKQSIQPWTLHQKHLVRGTEQTVFYFKYNVSESK